MSSSLNLTIEETINSLNSNIETLTQTLIRNRCRF